MDSSVAQSHRPSHEHRAALGPHADSGTIDL